MNTIEFKEDYLSFQKSVSELKKMKETLDKRIKELHEEEMRYLTDIPEFKKQADEERHITAVFVERKAIVREDLTKLNEEFHKVHNLLLESNRDLVETKEIRDKIIKENVNLNNKIDLRNADCKNREYVLQQKEKDLESSKLFLINRESELIKFEVELKNKEKLYDCKKEKLDFNAKIYESNVAIYDKNIKDLHERKRLCILEEEILKNRLEKSNKLIKENSDIKAQLIVQADKLSKDRVSCIEKQKSLDRSIEDLNNLENVLKIKELKISKMAHDAGLQRELRGLEISK